MTTVAHPKLNAPDLGNSPSTSEIITLHLRDAIVAGHFAEDEPIRQDDIARQFNVSKIPVREALKRLEAEGLVMFQRNRGAMVTRISDAELAQMFEVRMLLEDKLLRLAIPNMTEATFARAELICQEFVGEDDVGRWAELNWELHACLYEPAQRPFLISMVRSVNDKLERYLRMQMSLSAARTAPIMSTGKSSRPAAAATWNWRSNCWTSTLPGSARPCSSTCRKATDRQQPCTDLVIGAGCPA